MALSKPVVAFDVGGVGEMIVDGGTGALVSGEPPDVEGMASKFLSYLRDPALRRRQGEAARLHIEREFNGQTHSRRIQNEIVRAAGL